MTFKNLKETLKGKKKKILIAGVLGLGGAIGVTILVNCLKAVGSKVVDDVEEIEIDQDDEVFDDFEVVDEIESDEI